MSTTTPTTTSGWRWRNLLSRSILHIGLLGWTALVLIPFVLIILLSLRSNADIYTNGLGLGGDLRPGNYEVAWNGGAGTAGMATYFLNSAIVALTSLLVALGVGVTAAYFAIHLSERARKLFLMVFLVATVIPLVLMIVPFYQAFNTLGVVSQPVAVGLVYGALCLPVTILVVHAFFVDFPRELIEAAALDGTGAWRTYLFIVLPLARGPIAAVAMLNLVFVWAEAQLGVILLQSPDSQTVPVGLLSFQGQFTTDLGPLFAGLAIGSIPIMLIYLVFNRQVAKAITVGGFGGR
ncbi:carbohydrate ABC transporter permease [Microbacterium sulfonylureivorans]|uniref:carbohydrate ABC transporter permease n=1 Tax=Microbacterium sulfonylureivorans TaxID=2486854 RepID=UPI000FDB5B9A|nr:carbohydrate ABC transporter permease [Microbacterium sulfonylureivorans]